MPLARQIWSKRCTRYRAVQPSRFFGKSANWIPLSVSTVCSRYGTAREQCFEEAHGGRTISLVVQFDEGEFRGSVNRDKQVELALCCSNLSDVDMEIADWVGFESSFFGALVLNLRQARDAMPFQTAMQ